MVEKYTEAFWRLARAQYVYLIGDLDPYKLMKEFIGDSKVRTALQDLPFNISTHKPVHNRRTVVVIQSQFSSVPAM